MKSSRSNIEGWLFGLAFLFALALRLIQLGAWSLSDLEAAPALQALQLSDGLKPALDPQPGYTLFTAILFFAFGSGTNLLARLIPALAGSALVLVPYFFRHRLPPRAAVVLAFLLAVDPGLLSLSRQASGTILAITFLSFAWAMWEDARPRLAGFFGGLALLSGPAMWAGLLGLGITWALTQSMEVSKPQDNQATGLPADAWRQAALTLAATLLFVGTLFFMVPGGLSAAAASLPAYLSGWVAPVAVPHLRFLTALLLYQPLTLALALVGAVRGWSSGDRLSVRLSLWMSIAFLIALLYPAHQIADLGWVLLPLCALAAIELAQHLDVQLEERAEVGGVTALTVLIIVFAWLALSNVIHVPVLTPEVVQQIWLGGGAVALLAISLVLVAYGWSTRAAQRGGVFGVVIALGFYSLAAAFSAAGLRTQRTPELWSLGDPPAQADLLAATVDDLSEWQTGYVDSLPVIITGVDSPALQWALRDYDVRQADGLDISSSPPIVITSAQADPSLAAAYRGQDFSWRQTPQWENDAYPTAWDSARASLRWLFLRELPTSSETILLWARDDLFVDAAAAP